MSSKSRWEAKQKRVVRRFDPSGCLAHVFLDGDISEGTYEAFNDLCDKRSSCSLGFEFLSPPRRRPDPSEQCWSELMKCFHARQWMVFVYRRLEVNPDDYLRPTTSTDLMGRRLKEGGKAKKLPLGVFEASALILGRILGENHEFQPDQLAAPLPSGTADPPPEGDRTPEEPAAAGPLVFPEKRADEPTVNGRRKKRLTNAQYDVLDVLIAAGDDGLSKDSLATESGHGDAHRVLQRLAESDPDWDSVILMAEKPGGRYRIRTANLPTSPEVSRNAPTKRNRG